MSSLPADIAAIQLAVHTWITGASGLSDQNVSWGQQAASRPAGPWISMTVAGVFKFGPDWIDVDDNPLTLFDDDVEVVNTGTDELTLTGHSYVSGDGPIRLTTTGTLPAPLSIDTDYWIIVTSVDTIQLTTSLANANAVSPIVITDAGSGTHTIVGTAETLRLGEEILFHQRGPRHIRLQVQCFDGDAVGALASWLILETVRSSNKQPIYWEPLIAAGVGILRFGDIVDIGDKIRTSEFEPRSVMDVFLSVASQVTRSYTFIQFAQLMNQINNETFYVPNAP